MTSAISITINIPGAGDAGDSGGLGGISLDTGGMTPPPPDLDEAAAAG